MTACYGHIYNERGGIKCVRCGHGFYEHSHLETEMVTHPYYEEKRIKRTIIRLRYQPGDPVPEGNGGGVYRSAYDRMMDRQPGACEWVRKVMRRERQRPVMDILDSLARERMAQYRKQQAEIDAWLNSPPPPDGYVTYERR